MRKSVRNDRLVGTLNSVLPMIAKKARATYNKLPTSQKLGITVQDLINDGKTWLLSVIKKYDPKKWVKFSTWAYAVLDNYYIDVIRAAYADSRCAHVLSADSTLVKSSSETSAYKSLYDFLRDNRRDRRQANEDKLILRIDAERAFLKVYAGSSPLLRKYLIRWFLQPRESKFKDGLDFRAAIRMFSSNILSEELCRAIMFDHECRQNIANALISKFLTPSRPNRPVVYLRDSIEFEVLPILRPDRQKSLVAVYA